MRLVALVAPLHACSESPDAVAPAGRPLPPAGDLIAGPPVNVPAQGQYIFRHWTFGDEPFWTDTLHLNEVIETGVSPATALAVGLKVDAAPLPPGLLAGADLTSSATTVELLRRDAVVGVEAQVTADRHIKRLGITCALCHSTVDNSVAPGVGINLQQAPDRGTPVLPVLRAYQLSLNARPPAAGSFDQAAGERGKVVFTSTGRCASCHLPAMVFTDVNLGVLHDPSETGMDP